MVSPSGFLMAPIALLFCLLLSPSAAELPRLQHSPKSDGSLSLLVVGDWGRKGQFNQSLVAAQMGRIGEHLNIDFVISTGDNFYEDGLASVDDKGFVESFTNIYTANSLKKPWYIALGNHDYRGDVFAELSPDLRKVDCRFICMRSFVVNAEIVDFFFVDTTPFVLRYWEEKDPKAKYDWRGVAPRENYIYNQLKELDCALKQSRALWKIVVGHHTIRTAGGPGDIPELVQFLLPVLKANKVDLYVNGHDHCLQQISSRDSPLQFLTSGGGSKAWRGNLNVTATADKLKFFYDGQGFMSMHLTKTKVNVAFFDISGHVLHHWGRAKAAKRF